MKLFPNGLFSHRRKLAQISQNLEKLELALDRKFPEPEIKVVDSTPDRISPLRHKYLGERCFLLGTAPSLADFNVAALANERVFTVNGGYKLLDGPLDRLCGYCIADPIFYRDNNLKVDLSRIDHLFVSSTANISNAEHLKSACIFDSYVRPKMNQGLFQFDLTQPVYSSHTVMHHALQIVVYLGFRTIYLAGVDLDFGSERPHFYASSSREVNDSKTRSVKHAPKMLEGFKRAAKILSDRGIRLVNLSPGGALETIERAELSSVLER